MTSQELYSYKIISGHNSETELGDILSHKNYYIYDESMKHDGLIHLLYSGEAASSYSCSYKVSFIPCYHLLYIYEGTLEISCEDKHIVCPASSVIFVRLGESVLYETANGKCRFYEAVLTGGALSNYAAFLPHVIPYKKELSGASVLWNNIALVEKCQSTESVIDLFKMSKWFNDILTELCVYVSSSSKKKDSTPSYLMAIKEKMDTDFSSQFSLDDLEDEYRISRYRICREFSQHFGSSPMHYLNHQRILAAKRLLLTTDMSVHEVGSQVGIENTNHFINLFKKETGATPLSFKQAAPVSISELHYL